MPFWFAFKTPTLNMYFKSSLKNLKQSIILQNCFSLGYSLFSRSCYSVLVSLIIFSFCFQPMLVSLWSYVTVLWTTEAQHQKQKSGDRVIAGGWRSLSTTDGAWAGAFLVVAKMAATQPIGHCKPSRLF